VQTLTLSQCQFPTYRESVITDLKHTSVQLPLSINLITLNYQLIIPALFLRTMSAVCLPHKRIDRQH